MKRFKHEENVDYYLKRIYNIPLLSEEEEKALLKKVKEGDKEALKKIVLSNLRFVINIAKRYTGYSVLFSDLIAAGNLGLIEAAKKYDISKSVRFISYAVWWIKQSIFNTINLEGELIRKPNKVQNFNSKINYAYKNLKEKLDREPDSEEIFNYLKEQGINNIDIEIIEDYLTFKNIFLSLDSPLNDSDNDFILEDILSIHGTKDIEEEIHKEEIQKAINSLIESLSKREQLILIHRFGLHGEEPKTLEEVGKRIGISRERVRQIEKRLLKKLRKEARVKKLEDLIS